MPHSPLRARFPAAKRAGIGRVTAEDHWAFWGTGLSSGDKVPGAIGVEYDKIFQGVPTPVESTVLARSPVTTIAYDANNNEIGRTQTEADAVLSTDPDTRAKLFAAGSIIFSWRLEDPGISDIHYTEWQLAGPQVFPTSTALASMMRNLLDHFQAGPLAVVSLDAAAAEPVLELTSSSEESQFAPDSPLEGDGFEPSVPGDAASRSGRSAPTARQHSHQTCTSMQSAQHSNSAP